VKKLRLDCLVAQRGLAESREQAQRLIRAGQVRVNDQVPIKPDFPVTEDAVIEVCGAPRFVSRGGDKLEGAFDAFALDVSGRLCLDAGASTGGFTDCLLQHGARHVVAVDVGKGQLHWKLRNDSRVTLHEGVNARYLTVDLFPERPSFAVVDVSFISLTQVLPAVTRVLAEGAGMVTLIKPQFEAGRSQVGKGGVIRDAAVRQDVVDRIVRFVTQELGWTSGGVCESPLRGPAGNVEFLAYWLHPECVRQVTTRPACAG